jgi:hypothetical protein
MSTDSSAGKRWRQSRRSPGWNETWDVAVCLRIVEAKMQDRNAFEELRERLDALMGNDAARRRH